MVNRLSKYCPGITYKYHSGSRVTAEYNGHSLEFSNYDAFIDSQLRFYSSKNRGYIEYERLGSIKKKLFQNISSQHTLKKHIFNYLITKINTLKLKMKI